jgi:hypothetical protein
MFKRILIAALLATPLWALAADSAKATSAGADSAKAASGVDDKSKTTQRGKKMKACNRQAADKSLKGDDRKKFMSACLKSSAKS